MEYTHEMVDELWEDYRQSDTHDNSRMTANTMFDMMLSVLKADVGKEYEAELARLRKENEELNAFKNERAKFYTERAKMIREVEEAAETKLTELRKARLSELLFADSGYTVHAISTRPEKCDLCDESRKRHYTTPLGREATEPCTCSVYKHHYEPIEAKLFRIDEGRGPNDVYRYYHREGDYYYSANVFERKTEADHVYKYGRSNEDSTVKEFKDLYRYNAFFWRQEDAQRYADWLNEKEEANV